MAQPQSKLIDAPVVRAWSRLDIKRVGDTERREITGTATTPSTDRMGDIVEPLGLEFDNPIPLLWQHRHGEPVGWATLDKPTEKGITFSAKFADITEPGALKSRVDDAWQSIKAGLVRGISIGFKAKEHAWMDSGGVRFIKGEVIELSLVTIPANADASISTIKSYDAASFARDGALDGARKLSGAADKETRKPKDPKMPQPIAEQLSAYVARRKVANDNMIEMMQRRSDAGETLDDAESETYKGLEVEVEKLDEHIARLQKLEAQMKSSFAPVDGRSQAAASESRQPVGAEVLPFRQPGIEVRDVGSIRVKPNVPPATAFIRMCLAMMAGKGSRIEALEYARRRQDWLSSTPEVLRVLEDDALAYVMRAPVPAGTTYDSTWAGPLVVAQNIPGEFAEFLRPLTIIGRIPNLRRVPFNISLPRATAGTTAGWVGEAAPKPLTAMAFDTLTLRWAKAAAISVLTEELVRFSNPAAEDIVRSDLARGIVQFLDRQFVDPSVAAVANVSPGSITNGITPQTPTGTNMAAFRADMKTLFAGILAANQSTAGGFWIMTQQQALSLSLAQNALGQTIFPTVNAESGGTLLGYPVIASENIPATGGSPADGYPLIFAIAPEILLADDGVVTVDASREASLQMDSAPDSPPTASTNMLSLWQLNMLGLRAERWITWQRRRSTAVAWIQNAKYAE